MRTQRRTGGLPGTSTRLFSGTHVYLFRASGFLVYYNNPRTYTHSVPGAFELPSEKGSLTLMFDWCLVFRGSNSVAIML